MFQRRTKISDFSGVIYTTSKNELKMIWLSRNTKILDSFLPQKMEVYACSIWSSYSVSEFTDNQPCWRVKHKWRPHHRRQKNYGSHTIARIHNIVHVNFSTCTCFFPKQTESWVPRNSIELFYSHPCLMFHDMRYILTLHEKHNIENKWPHIWVSNKKTSVERY